MRWAPSGDTGRRDALWMGRALRLAAEGRGRTSPNPMVGAVLVKDDRVVGEGAHLRAGEPHAEAIALAAAGDAARGAACYVTLEPCAHVGRTPPCADALVRAGVARVVAAVRGPEPAGRRARARAPPGGRHRGDGGRPGGGGPRAQSRVHLRGDRGPPARHAQGGA